MGIVIEDQEYTEWGAAQPVNLEDENDPWEFVIPKVNDGGY